VAHVVRFGNDYVVVPDRIIDGLIDRADRESGLHHLQIASPFVPGATVRITSGAFAGFEGIFESEDANDRVVVLLGLLGREARIRISAGRVMPSQAASFFPFQSEDRANQQLVGDRQSSVLICERERKADCLMRSEHYCSAAW